MPVGAICVWLNSAGLIPAGWQICDGSNGTPDLRSKYIKGAANAGEIGGTGGTLTHTHTANSHSHAATSHTHATQNTSADAGGAGFNATAPLVTVSITGHFHAGIPTGATDAGATDSVAETVSTVNHEPPYLTVIYIQRLV